MNENMSTLIKNQTVDDSLTPAAEGRGWMPLSEKWRQIKERVLFLLLTNFKPFWDFVQSTRYLERLANKLLINRAGNNVGKRRPRPYTLKHNSDFISWDSLTDKTWSARHLPPASERYMARIAQKTAKDAAKILFERQGEPKLSSTSTLLLAYFAQWLAGSFFHARVFADENKTRAQFGYTDSKHEIDLSPVYGPSPRVTHKLRLNGEDKDRLGELRTQKIGEDEYPEYYFHENGVPKDEFKDIIQDPSLGQVADPAQKCSLFAMGTRSGNRQICLVMINTLFIREHNRLCRAMRRDSRSQQWDDERLFQTARNTLIAMAIKITIEDYINHIAPYHFKFRAYPDQFHHAKWYKSNWIAVEFNLLYRWHGMLPNELHINGAKMPLRNTILDNRFFSDQHGCNPASDRMAVLMQASSLQSAGEIGLLNSEWESMGPAEVDSFERARHARLASYNDYRSYCGLHRVRSFAEVSSDERIEEALRQVYKTVDDIEFYPGLFAEDKRPGSPVGSLMGKMIGMEAFSQALTNPLLSENVWSRKEEVFSPVGWEAINSTSTLHELAMRNIKGIDEHSKVTFDLLA